MTKFKRGQKFTYKNWGTFRITSVKGNDIKATLLTSKISSIALTKKQFLHLIAQGLIRWEL